MPTLFGTKLLVPIAKGAKSVARSYLQGVATAGATAAQAFSEPLLRSIGRAPGTLPDLRVPGFGRIPVETAQARASRYVNKGDKPITAALKSGGLLALEEPVGVAGKPILIGAGVFGRPLVEAFKNVGRSKNLVGQAPKVAQTAGKATKTLGVARQALSQSLQGGKGATPKIPSLLGDGIPPSDPVKKVVDALTKAKPMLGKQAALYRAERARRVAKIASAGSRVPGEQGFFAQLGAAKGQLPKVQFESIRPQVTQKDVDDLFNIVETSRIFSPFEKLTAKSGLAKVLGKEGGSLPTRGEIELMSEVFPREFMEAVMAKRSTGEKVKDVLGQAINLPRSVMATADLSAPLRQGIFLVGRPRQFFPAFKDMFKYAFDQKAYEGLTESIQARPTYQLMRQNGLALTDMGKFMNKREEAFMSNLAEKIPGFGKLARGSNRAYTGFLNKLRADVFDDLLKNATRLGVYDQRPEVVADIAKFVNSATGRGDIGALNRASTILNAVFFSPRLMASRLNLINPVYYGRLDPFVRKEALKSLFTFAGTAVTALTLAKFAGADVENDPRSADFAKIRIDNTRYDIMGGFQQYVRLAAQLATGKIISSTTGKEITLGEGYKPLTRKDITLRFFESKESPVASFVSGLFTGKDNLGNDFDVPKEAISRIMPLYAQDVYDLVQEWGPEGALLGVPGFFGVGSMTYGTQKLVEGEDSLGKRTAELRPTTDLSQKIREKLLGAAPLKATPRYAVQEYFEDLKKLPKEEASSIFQEIAEKNPDLAEKISQVAEDEALGLTVEEQSLKDKGVASGDRARAIAEKFKDLDTKEEKASLWQEYIDKGVITEEVSEQLIDLVSRTDGKATEKSFIDTIKTYAEAIGTDPVTAFDRIFTGQKIIRVDNGAVIVRRLPVEDSQRIREEREGNTPEYRLDHTVPLQLGGSNSEKNLRLVPTSEHEKYTPVENYLGRLLRAKKINKKQAQEAIRAFKNGERSFEEIQSQFGEQATATDLRNPVAMDGNRPQRNNNPLNIKASEVTLEYPGVVGADTSPATDGGQFLVFESPEAGFDAAKRLITNPNYQNLSVEQALRRWSNRDYGAEIIPELARKSIDSLSDEELDTLVRAMAEREGYFA